MKPITDRRLFKTVLVLSGIGIGIFLGVLITQHEMNGLWKQVHELQTTPDYVPALQDTNNVRNFTKCYYCENGVDIKNDEFWIVRRTPWGVYCSPECYDVGVNK